jgi:hypothetical protein
MDLVQQDQFDNKKIILLLRFFIKSSLSHHNFSYYQFILDLLCTCTIVKMIVLV